MGALPPDPWERTWKGKANEGPVQVLEPARLTLDSKLAGTYFDGLKAVLSVVATN